MRRFGEDYDRREIHYTESFASDMQSSVWSIKLVSMADIGLPKRKLKKFRKRTKDKATLEKRT